MSRSSTSSGFTRSTYEAGHLVPTPSLDVWAGLRHSSRIVTPPPGEACRVSPRHELIGPFAGAAQAETSGTGTDPQIYAVGGDPLQVGPVDASGYQYGKVLWIA